MRNAIILLFVLLGTQVHAQIIPSERLTNWQNPGARDSFDFIRTTLYFEDFADWSSPLVPQDSALAAAIDFLGDIPLRIIFPEGDFYFKKTIQMRSNLILEGAGAGKTIFYLDPQDHKDGISATGEISPENLEVSGNIQKGDRSILLEYTSDIQAGDWVKLSFNDSVLIASSWAIGSVGQIMQVKSIFGRELYIEKPLRISIPLSSKPVIKKVTPVKNIKIERISIKMENENHREGANIYWNYVCNGIIREIESSYCNFSHVLLQSCSNTSVSCSYFSKGFRYGNGGEAYGLTLQGTSGDCLISNNILDSLRHAILLQSGANGNVISYNYSDHPYWTETRLPFDAAGDLVLHGNYPHHNLWEGNVCQNIVIDDSHEKNGPFNTFFRNRTMRYGLFMGENPPSDSQNIIANVLLPYPDYEVQPILNIKGNEHYIRGNNFRDQIVPPGSVLIQEHSLYLNQKPAFFYNHPWPPIDPVSGPTFLDIPAFQRYHTPTLSKIGCYGDSITTTTVMNKPLVQPFQILPNPGNGNFELTNLKGSMVEFTIMDIAGKILWKKSFNGGKSISLTIDLNDGLYFLKAYYPKENIFQLRKIIFKN